MNANVIAQIICVCAALSMVYANFKKTKKEMMTFITLGSILYCLQYLFLNAYNGFFTNIVNMFRNLLFSLKSKSKYLKSVIFLVLFIIIYIGVGIFTYDGFFSLFPTIGSLIYCVILWQDNPKVIRIGNTVCYLFWFIYDIFVKLYIGAVIDFSSFAIGMIAIIKLNEVRKNKKKSTKK